MPAKYTAKKEEEERNFNMILENVGRLHEQEWIEQCMVAEKHYNTPVSSPTSDTSSLDPDVPFSSSSLSDELQKLETNNNTRS